jgi:hypothetical protein
LLFCRYVRNDKVCVEKEVAERATAALHAELEKERSSGVQD